MFLKKTFLKRLLSFYLSLFLLLGPSFSFLAYAEEEELGEAVVVEEEVPAEVVEPEVVEEELAAAVVAEEEDSLNIGGSAVIETGDAVALANTEAEVNTNVNLIEETVVEEELLSEEEEIVEPAVVEEEIEEECVVACVEVENDNEATVSGETQAQADTGDNSIEGATESASLETAVIETGDAQAQANTLALVNTNLTGSEFEYVVLNDEDLADGADFAEDWQEFESGLENEDQNSQVVVVENENLAEVDLTTVAIANSGDNSIEGAGEAVIETGDALALANSMAVVNTNFTESNFLYAVINIFDSFEGDLVFPSPDHFLNSVNQEGSLVLAGDITIENDNVAFVESTASSSADSGNNQIMGTGSSLIETGEAISIANIFNWVNQNFVGVNFFNLLFNNFGNWDGSLRNWEGAGSVQDLGQGTYLFQFGNWSTEANSDGSDSSCCGSLEVINRNEATVTTTTLADANTGNNQISQGGAGEINTGQAIAIANSANVINSNFTKSNFFFGVFNLFGEFKGDLVFSYPDLSIEISDHRDEVLPGEQISYEIYYHNLGQAPAYNVNIHQDLPEELVLLSVNSPQPEVNGNSFDWQLPELAPGETGKITVTMEVVGEVEEKTLSSQIQIGADGQDLDLENNFAFDETNLVLSQEENLTGDDDGNGDENNDQDEFIGEVKLTLVSSNNVHEFIYPGDTILFKIVVKNEGDRLAKEVLLFNQLYNQIPGPLDEARIELGELEPGEEEIIEFGYTLPDQPGMVHPGTYRLESWLEANDEGENLVTSNIGITYFEVRVKEGFGLISPVGAAEEGQVLGAGEEVCLSSETEEKLLPYLLLFAMSSLWLVEKGRRFLIQVKN